jgi:hypothetical protein
VVTQPRRTTLPCNATFHGPGNRVLLYYGIGQGSMALDICKVWPFLGELVLV